MEISGMYGFLAASLGGLFALRLYETNKKQKIQNENSINQPCINQPSNEDAKKIYNLKQISLIAKERGIDHLLNEKEWNEYNRRKMFKK